MCSRRVSLPEVTDQRQLANVKPTVPTCDDDVKPLEATQANLLTHSAMQDTSRVADLSDDHMSETVYCDDVEFEEEIQEG